VYQKNFKISNHKRDDFYKLVRYKFWNSPCLPNLTFFRSQQIAGLIEIICVIHETVGENPLAIKTVKK